MLNGIVWDRTVCLNKNEFCIEQPTKIDMP